MTPLKRQLVVELSAQHERLEAMARTVRDSEGEEREQAFTTMRRFLAAHESVEQAVMHPTFSSRDRQDLSVTHRVREEESAAEALARLEERDLGGQPFLDGLETFAADLRHHTEQEEHDELPGFLQRITDDDAEEIVEALRLVPAIAAAGEMTPGAGKARYADMLQTARTDFDDRQRAGTKG